MPWKEFTVEYQRQQLCYRIVHQKEPVAAVCREYKVSPKTAYKWLARYRLAPDQPLVDRSRRPKSSPKRTPEVIEQKVLSIHDQHRWGGRKINRLLLNERLDDTPSIRTITTVLKRHGRTRTKVPEPPSTPPIRFERSSPNELWQLDHKGPCEIQRARYHPFTVVDDHSRYCFCFEPLLDKSIASYWPVLWDIFGDVGLPEAILCDNGFSAAGRGLGLSEFDMRLIRLGIRPAHGQAYHPQTQGKVERLHLTADYELLTFKPCLDRMSDFVKGRDAWRHAYNHLRPHESLGDRPPISRWQPSTRRRPRTLPEVEYDAGAVLRKVSQVGDIHYRGARIGVSRSLARQWVRIEEREHEIGIFYSWKELRTIRHERLKTASHNELVK